MNQQETPTFEGFAIVELMGHGNVIAGYCTQEVIGGTVMLRIDVPETGGEPAFTKYYSGAAIYGVTPTDEQTARVAAERVLRRPVEMWIVPDRPALSDSGLPDPDRVPAGRDYGVPHDDGDDESNF